MARQEDIANKSPEPPTIATATAGVCTATRAAPGVGNFLAVTGITISSSGTIAAAVAATLKDGTTVIDRWELPASAIAPISINYNRPLVCSDNAAAVLSVPSLGGGITCTVVLRTVVLRSS